MDSSHLDSGLVIETDSIAGTDIGCADDGRMATKAGRQGHILHSIQNSLYGSDDWQRFCRVHTDERTQQCGSAKEEALHIAGWLGDKYLLVGRWGDMEVLCPTLYSAQCLTEVLKERETLFAISFTKALLP